MEPYPKKETEEDLLAKLQESDPIAKASKADDVLDDPFEVFKNWFQQARKHPDIPYNN